MAFEIQWRNRTGRGLQLTWRSLLLGPFATLVEAEGEALALANANIECRVVDLGEAPASPKAVMDLTPRGCETPEGVARVNKAMEAFESSHVVVANEATAFLRKYKDYIEAAMVQCPDPDSVADYRELEQAVAGRGEAQDAFLRAVAGQPAGRAS